MKRMRVGEIAEIQTPSGLAYAHHVLRHSAKPVMGDLHRVLPGLYKSRPDDLVGLAYGPHLLVSFCPLSQGFKDGTVRIVGYAEPTREHAAMPTFRQLQLLCGDGRPRWSLWDGRKDQIVDELTPQQRAFPRGPVVCNVIAFIDAILFHNGVITPQRRQLLDQRRKTLGDMADAFAASGDPTSAANLYIELLDTHPDDKTLQKALRSVSPSCG